MLVAILKSQNIHVLERGNKCVEFSEDWLTATVTISYPTYEKTYTLSGEAALEWAVNWR